MCCLHVLCLQLSLFAWLVSRLSTASAGLNTKAVSYTEFSSGKGSSGSLSLAPGLGWNQHVKYHKHLNVVLQKAYFNVCVKYLCLCWLDSPRCMEVFMWLFMPGLLYYGYDWSETKGTSLTYILYVFPIKMSKGIYSRIHNAFIHLAICLKKNIYYIVWVVITLQCDWLSFLSLLTFHAILGFNQLFATMINTCRVNLTSKGGKQSYKATMSDVYHVLVWWTHKSWNDNTVLWTWTS